MILMEMTRIDIEIRPGYNVGFVEFNTPIQGLHITTHLLRSCNANFELQQLVP
jgi:hypothetical protein